VLDSEFFRLVRRPANWVMPGILILFVGFIYGVQWVVYSFGETDTGNATVEAETATLTEEALQLQNVGANWLAIAVAIGSVLIAVMAAQTIGNEYSWGTIRALVPRSRRRSEIIASKLVATVLYALVLTLIALVVSVIITLVIDAATDIESTVDAGVIGNIIASTGRSFLAIAVYGVMGLMITVLTRSTAAGIAITIALQFLEQTIFALMGLASDTLGDLQRYFVANNVNTLVLANNPDASMRGTYHGPWVAAAFLFGWSLLFIVLSFVIFQRRDITPG
jgi:ABC-2 type transport system permease protein